MSNLDKKIENHIIWLNNQIWVRGEIWASVGQEQNDKGKQARFVSNELSYQKLNDLDLTRAKFSGANLSTSTFTNCNFSKCDFSDARINYTKFINCNLTSSKFKDADLENTIFLGSDLKGCSFFNAKISGTDFTNAIIRAVDFRHSTFGNAGMFYPKGLFFIRQLNSQTYYAVLHKDKNTFMIYGTGFSPDIDFWGDLETFERLCLKTFGDDKTKNYYFQIAYLKEIINNPI